MRRSCTRSAGLPGRRIVSPERSEAGELGRGAAFFGVAVGLFSITCCGVLALLLGSAAGLAVSSALAGPLGPVVGGLLLALDALFVGWIVARRIRRAARGRADARTAAPPEAPLPGPNGGAATGAETVAEADHRAA